MPLPRRKKLIALGTIAAGTLVLCTALVAFHDRLRETWYLWRLDTTEDPASRAQIIERLGGVGRERSFRVLCQDLATECPFAIWTRGLPALRGESLIVPLVRPPPEACREYPRAINRIRERIGRRKSIALVVDLIRTKTAALEARVYGAQTVVIALCPKENLPEEMKAMMTFPIDPGTPEWAILRAGQEDAIDVLVDGLGSQNSYCRAGASFALSLCGPEASAAIPRRGLGGTCAGSRCSRGVSTSAEGMAGRRGLPG